MTHFSPRPSLYRREWVNDLPMKYCAEWQRLGLVKSPTKKDGTTVRSIPFYAAQQLHKIEKIPRQLRGATKPIVVTTSKIGEPYYTPQLDFDLRTAHPLPLTYNNLLDPHLKHYFSNPVKRRVLEKRGFITRDGDVICHTMKELNQYRELLYYSHQEMLKVLRKDINTYLPRIIAKRRAIAEITSEQRRYNLLQRPKSKVRKMRKKPSRKIVTIQEEAPRNFEHTAPKGNEQVHFTDRKYSEKEMQAATKIKAIFKGYIMRKKLAQAYKRSLREEMKRKPKCCKKNIWEKSNRDVLQTCHVHSCTESLARQFVINDLPTMMKFLKDPVAQQTYRKNVLLKLMHTPCKDITGTMVKPLLKDEIRQHSSKFRWV